MYQTNECFGDIAQENAQKVNGYIVYNFHTGEIDYEVERKYWDRSDQRTFKDLAASNINCYFIPLHIFQNAEKANAGFVARFAILDD